jgi:probable blue pigment (indigoidine) exporter
MRSVDAALTAFAVVIWGTTYLVTTQLLPPDYPLTASLLRALPAGLLLLAWVRELPRGIWLLRVFILGVLNFSLFWYLLFVGAYRLPGGVAATVGAIQPLVVVLLARPLLGTPLRLMAVVAALGGLVGVALLLLRPTTTLDPIGVAASLGGAVSMALGTVMTRRWQPPVSALTFTAWQLTAGGLQLLPFALAFEWPLPHLTPANIAGFLWLGIMGAAVSYALWFRGIARLGAAAVSPLVLLSPVTAVVLGWFVLRQTLSAVQLGGMALVLASVWLGQRAQARRPAVVPTAPRAAPAQ